MSDEDWARLQQIRAERDPDGLFVGYLAGPTAPRTATTGSPEPPMDRARFDDYIRRFNAEDDTAFDDYLAPDLHMKNGTLEFTGVLDGMKHHYRDLIWPHFTERLTVPRFVGGDGIVAIQMNTLFTARRDAEDTIFGPVRDGETFEFDGVIMYDLDESDRFADILVAYNSFVHTDRDGNRRDLGIPH